MRLRWIQSSAGFGYAFGWSDLWRLWWPDLQWVWRFWRMWWWRGLATAWCLSSVLSLTVPPRVPLVEADDAVGLVVLSMWALSAVLSLYIYRLCLMRTRSSCYLLIPVPHPSLSPPPPWLLGHLQRQWLNLAPLRVAPPLKGTEGKFAHNFATTRSQPLSFRLLSFPPFHVLQHILLRVLQFFLLFACVCVCVRVCVCVCASCIWSDCV